jgi:RNA polymerase sigma-70 factor, ECF subfamily
MQRNELLGSVSLEKDGPVSMPDQKCGHSTSPAMKNVAFPAVMARLRAGDEAAAREVYARWAERLIGLTRTKLGKSITAREDPEEVVQSVYRSFFRRYGDGNFHVEDWHDVWALLATIAKRKCLNRRKYYSAECRAASREMPLDLTEPASADPAPDEAAILAETVERMLLRFPPKERAIVELSLQGHTVKEIGARLGRANRSVNRIREYVQKWLLQQAGDC